MLSLCAVTFHSFRNVSHHPLYPYISAQYTLSKLSDKYFQNVSLCVHIMYKNKCSVGEPCIMRRSQSVHGTLELLKMPIQMDISLHIMSIKQPKY